MLREFSRCGIAITLPLFSRRSRTSLVLRPRQVSGFFPVVNAEDLGTALLNHIGDGLSHDAFVFANSVDKARAIPSLNSAPPAHAYPQTPRRRAMLWATSPLRSPPQHSRMCSQLSCSAPHPPWCRQDTCVTSERKDDLLVRLTRKPTCTPPPHPKRSRCSGLAPTPSLRSRRCLAAGTR